MVIIALQMAVDLDGCCDKAQIPGGGLPQSQQADTFFLDLHIDPVNLIVVTDDLLRQTGIPLQEGLDAALNCPLRQGTHIE
jgi:hypothetical protein